VGRKATPFESVDWRIPDQGRVRPDKEGIIAGKAILSPGRKKIWLDEEKTDYDEDFPGLVTKKLLRVKTALILMKKDLLSVMKKLLPIDERFIQ
jgi:hypothetical protein